MPLAVEVPLSVRQSNGTMKTEWVADVIKWRAAIRRLQGRELVVAQQMQGAATHEVVGRYRKGLTHEHRFVKPDGVHLNIVSVDNVDDRNVTLKVRCKEQI